MAVCVNGSDRYLINMPQYASAPPQPQQTLRNARSSEGEGVGPHARSPAGRASAVFGSGLFLTIVRRWRCWTNRSAVAMLDHKTRVSNRRLAGKSRANAFSLIEFLLYTGVAYLVLGFGI
jgi:hypothetical protein